MSTAVSSSRLWQMTIADHVVDLDWRHDGQQLAVAAVSGPILVADAASGDTIVELAGHDRGTTSIAWRPNDELLTSGGQDSRVRYWKTDGDEIAVVDAGAWVERVVWGDDGERLAVAAGRRVLLLDADGRVTNESAEHTSTVSDVAWAPGAAQLASSAYGGLRLWNPAKGETSRLDWTGSVLRVAWSPDGRHIATGDQDATVHFWIVERAVDLMMSGFETKVLELAWDSSGRYLATGGGSEVTVWDCSGRGPEGRAPMQFDPGSDRVTALAFGPDDLLLAAGTDDGGVFVWALRGSRRPILRARVGDEVTAISWSRDGSTIVVGDHGGGISAFVCPALAAHS